MKSKRNLIFNADDFGKSEKINQAVKEGYLCGVLTSACLLANGAAFDDAVLRVLPKCEGMGLGVHLNVVEGKTLAKVLNPKSKLYDKNGNFKNGFVSLLFKSFDRQFLNEIEHEFRLQIEKIQTVAQVDHINSHVHIHAIPNIFELVCKLAKEYKIEYVRTQFETPYLIPNFLKCLTPRFFVNILKNIILNYFTKINSKILAKYVLKTNENFVGVLYTGFMDKNTIKYGLKASGKRVNTIEIIAHPSVDKSKKRNYKEYLALLDTGLKRVFEEECFEPVNYKDDIRTGQVDAVLR